MHKRKLWGALLTLPLLMGCALWGRTPTPIPWLPTPTPHATIGAQAADTATATTVPTIAKVTPTRRPPTITPSPVPTLTPVATRQQITLDIPGEGQPVPNPLHVRGRTAVMPFEGTLIVRVYDAHAHLAAEQPINAQGQIGGPATFEGSITYGGIPGPGRVEVVELSPKDGSVTASTSVGVTLTGFPGGGAVELPLPFARVTLPIQMLARVGRPGQQVEVTVSWADGTKFAHHFTTLEGLDGRGLLIVPLDFIGTAPPPPPTQAGAIEIHTLDGSPLAYQPLQILHPADPGTMSTKVYWVRQEQVIPQPLRIPRTPGIGRASLEALLWGPVPQNSEGYGTALPTPADVLSYPGRGPDWGERVRLQDLKIIDGVAYADFSPELRAHSGGALQVSLMRSQIEQTLLQFSTVNQVVITVNGQTGWLEP